MNAATGRTERSARRVAFDTAAFRVDLHRHPERSWEEHRTTARIRDVLAGAGLEPRDLVTDTGCLVELGPADAHRRVLLRADIDALAMEDAKDVPHRSTVPGVAHACGHDAHTALVLAAALDLADRLDGDGTPGAVRVVFQPAEEAVPGGAARLVEAGLCDGVDAALAVHCDPSLEVGRVGLTSGPVTSAADQVVIDLEGPGGHTARPHLSADLGLVAGRVLTDLPMALARRTDPRDAASLVFGSIRGGEAPNVIPRSVQLRGTMRTRGWDAWRAAPEVLGEALAGIARTYGAHAELHYVKGSPPVVNDPEVIAAVSAAARHLLGDAGVAPTTQSAGSEDFSWIADRVPSAYIRLGVRPAGADDAPDLHSPGFDVPDQALDIGADLLRDTALRLLRA